MVEQNRIPTPDPTQNHPENLPRPVENPPLRVRRTHLSDAISGMLKTLSLPSRLKRNKEIETLNEARNLRNLSHLQNPENPPGSETASFITIESSEINLLSSSSLFNSLHDTLPFYIMEKLALLKSLTDKNKRRLGDESLTDSIDDSALRIAKRRCMTAKSLISRNFQSRTSFNFPQIMFDTEDRMALPLSFFTHKSLRFMIDNLALLPIRKVEANGVHKKGSILDVEKLSKTLGEELSLTYGQYSEAASQMFNFQAQRDNDSPSDGATETWTRFWELHFLFFDNQDDAEEYYDEWKHVELDLRRERWSYNYKYNEDYYASRYMTAKNNRNIRIQFDEEMNRREARLRAQFEAKTRPREYASGSGSRYGPVKPFPEAGSRPSASASCVLCADPSHTLFNHPREKIKFSDGKPLWAKTNGNKLMSPNGKEICIRFNIGGSRYCSLAYSKDKHGDNRLHVCSFCGGKDHHALSWVCRNKEA